MSDTTAKTQADYSIAIEKAVARIGTSNGSKLPQSNDSKDALVQEYAIASMLSSEADKRLRKAKAALIAAYPPVQQLGMHMQHDSTFALCVYEVKNGPRMISADRLRNALLKYNLKPPVIDAIIDASKGDATYATSIKTTLKA